ncbi:hypothetical protein D9M68_491920 [compost metagenome]
MHAAGPGAEIPGGEFAARRFLQVAIRHYPALAGAGEGSSPPMPAAPSSGSGAARGGFGAKARSVLTGPARAAVIISRSQLTSRLL